MTGEERSQAYGAAVTWGASLASIVISLVVSFTVSGRAANAERIVREDNRIATCIVVTAQVRVYADTPPITRTGVKAEQAWKALSTRLRCG